MFESHNVITLQSKQHECILTGVNITTHIIPFLCFSLWNYGHLVLRFGIFYSLENADTLNTLCIFFNLHTFKKRQVDMHMGIIYNVDVLVCVIFIQWRSYYIVMVLDQLQIYMHVCVCFILMMQCELSYINEWIFASFYAISFK